MINKILLDSANEIEKIDFYNWSEKLILNKLKNYEVFEIFLNYSFLIKNSVRFKKLKVLEYLLKLGKENNFNFSRYKYLNLEFFLDSNSLNLLKKVNFPINEKILNQFNKDLKGL